MIYYASSLESFEGRICSQELYSGYGDGWLVALDCRSGKMTHQINLKKAVSEGLGRALDVNELDCPNNKMGLAQTEGHLMLNVSGSADKGFTACLVIDKKSGKAKALPPGVIIGNNRMEGGPVIGYGGNFYFLDDAFHQKGSLQRASHNTYKLSLFRLNPETMKLTSVTEYGRRPAMTPFDDADRQPTALSTNKGRMAVYNEKIFAFYDPDTGAWQIQEGDARMMGANLIKRLEKDFFSKLEELQIEGKASGWRVNLNKYLPGRIQFERNNMAPTQLPLTMNLPEDYQKNTWFKLVKDQNGGGRFQTYKCVSFEQFADDFKFFAQVLNQTEDDLIMSFQFGRSRGWVQPTRFEPQLPFIWKIPKQQVRNALGISP